jgi:hypothetical protein
LALVGLEEQPPREEVKAAILYSAQLLLLVVAVAALVLQHWVLADQGDQAVAVAASMLRKRLALVIHLQHLRLKAAMVALILALAVTK